MQRVPHDTRFDPAFKTVHEAIDHMSALLCRMIPLKNSPNVKKLAHINNTANSLSRLVRSLRNGHGELPADSSKDEAAARWVENLVSPMKSRTQKMEGE